MVETVFLSKKIFQGRVVSNSGLVEKTNITAGTEGAKGAHFVGATYGHRFYFWISLPFG